MNKVEAVVFDCDGVLVDITSSWQQIHNYFGTNNKENLTRFLEKEISDDEFMELDVKLWLEIQEEIHMDEIMRCFSGVKLMKGAREVIVIISHGIFSGPAIERINSNDNLSKIICSNSIEQTYNLEKCHKLEVFDISKLLFSVIDSLINGKSISRLFD